MVDTTPYQITQRPIDGSKYEENIPAEQMDSAEFLALVDQLLAVEGVEKIQWNQYTPYFNDGDPCEFSVYEVDVKLDPEVWGQVVDSERDGNWVTNYDLYDYDKDIKPTEPRPNYNDRDAYRAWADSQHVWEINGHSTVALRDAMRAFDSKQANFETVAKNNFGDHAQVTADDSGFNVEFYEHD